MIEVLRNIAPLAVILAGIAGFFGLSSMKRAPEESEITIKYPEIATEDLREHTGGFAIDVDGLVVPFREISLSAEAAGRVIFKSEQCEAGRYVRAPRQGETATPLIRIDPQDYELDVRRLRAQLEQADVAIDESEEDARGTASLITLAQRDVDLRGRELARARQLSNVNSASELERVERDELVARNALVKLQNQHRLLLKRRASLEASQRLAQAQLERAELDLRRTSIHVPTDGMIVKEMVEQDDFVQKGTPLLVMEDTSRVEVTVNLRMDQMYWLWLGDNPQSSGASPPDPKQDYELPRAEARVVYELAGRQYVWDGHLDRFDGVGLDERTRTIPCRVVVDDPRAVSTLFPGDRDPGDSDPGDSAQSSESAGPPALLRGMYVTVKILVNPRTEPGRILLRIPRDALRPGERIWIERDGVLRIVKAEFVRLIQRNQDALVQVRTRDVKAGDQLIVSPLSDVREGMRLLPERAATAGAETR